MLKPGYVRYRTTRYLQSIALDRRWMGQADYTRFIVLGRSRVGSNLLRGLLNAHSQTVVLGELFQNKNEIGWAMDGFPANERTRSLFLQQPVDFLESKVWRNYPEGVTAVGFKLFYYHARDDVWAPLWTHLGEDKGVSIVHITRQNMLKTHLSRQRAMQSAEWVNTSGAPSRLAQQITLDVDECRLDFETTRAWQDEMTRQFQDHSVLDVTYEALAVNRDREMSRIQQFLGVQPEALEPETFKQRHRSLRDTIANYDELKVAFADTDWASFFED